MDKSMNARLAHWKNPRWSYQDSATHADAESFRRRQEQRQREAEQHRREADERDAANEVIEQ